MRFAIGIDLGGFNILLNIERFFRLAVFGIGRYDKREEHRDRED